MAASFLTDFVFCFFSTDYIRLFSFSSVE